MTTLVERLRSIQHQPNAQAWLHVIREGESNQDNAAYRTQVGGRLIKGPLDDHPREVLRVRIKGHPVRSSAAGAFQFLTGTWNECADALALPDFSSESQDLAALYLTRRRGALGDVLAGRVKTAIAKCAREWASLPGDAYDQGGMTMEHALATWRQWGGSDEVIE